MSFLSRAIEHIRKSEYHIRWNDETGAFHAANRAQNLRFSYRGNSFTVEPREPTEEEPAMWHLQLSLLGVGRADSSSRPFAGNRWACDKNVAQVSDEALLIDYRNTEDGMRQTFVINSPPAGNGPLRLDIAIAATGCEPALADGGVGITFAGQREEVLLYDGLNVWDARGRTLEARFVDNNGTGFSIIVDDAEAVYPVVIDPLTHVKYYSNGQAGAKFGFSVAAIPASVGGLIIGAPYYDGGSANEGKVFVYLASSGEASTFPNDPSWTAESDEANAYLGWSVASSSFANVAGCIFVIVAGAPYADGGGTDRGKALMWEIVNDASADGTYANATWQANGGINGEHFGMSVASDGDADNDGFHDILVGSPDYDLTDQSGTHPDVGRAFLFRGSSSGANATPARTYTGTFVGSYGSRLGESVALLGEVNSTSGTDYAIGGPYADYYGSLWGAVYVYHGAATLPTSPALTIWGSQSFGKFGFSVASAGDVDGDDDGNTYKDLLVGATEYSNGHSAEGKVFLFKANNSGTGLSTTIAWSVEGNQTNARFGWSLAAGDVNSDGYSDMIVGGPYFDYVQGNTDDGVVALYNGTSSGVPDTTPDGNIFDETGGSGAHCGYSVAFMPTFGLLGPHVLAGAPDSLGTGYVFIQKWTNP